MLEDRILLWRIKHSSPDALRRLYDKYKHDLLALATALLHDLNAAEDVVHDAFVSFVQSVDKFQLTGTLKGYLLTCVANLARDRIRATKRMSVGLPQADLEIPDCRTPEKALISTEELQRLRVAIAELPYEQREVVMLHLQGEQPFKAIAQLRGVSVSTIQSRYRYGVAKLRALVNSEMKK